MAKYKIIPFVFSINFVAGNLANLLSENAIGGH